MSAPLSPTNEASNSRDALDTAKLMMSINGMVRPNKVNIIPAIKKLNVKNKPRHLQIEFTFSGRS
jgi:hypothetical protein